MMHRVVVTGLGILSSLGGGKEEVLASLRESRSGLQFLPEMEAFGLRCGVYGPVKGGNPARLEKGARQKMGTVAQYAAVAALDALEDAGLEREVLKSPRAGVVVGTAFSGINQVFPIEKMIRKGKPSRAGITGVVKVMNSSASGNLAAYLGVQGRSCSISSSFATGPDNIGYAYELIKYGTQDLCICGAAEEDCWRQVGVFFENWGGVRGEWNQEPSRACRPYDRDRRGPVLSAGAGILILERLERATKRNARIYGEVVGFGSANDGEDLFRPTGEGLKQALRSGLNGDSAVGVKGVDYMNTHGTGTPIGDDVEVRAIRDVFGASCPPVSSTKGLSGHALGATGALEAVYTLLMLHHGFMAPTVNLENIAEECSGVPHIQCVREAGLKTVATFSVGLGGANSCLVFRAL